MAELLVKAKAHWMDSMSQADVEAHSEANTLKIIPGASQETIDKRKSSRVASWKARAQIGDIIAVMQDGHVWGREEKLPNYIVIKLPGKTKEELEYLKDSLEDSTAPNNRVLLKKRKWAVPPGIITAIINANENAQTVLGQQQTNFINNLIEKTS